MSSLTQINYSDLISGRAARKRPSRHPIGDWLSAQGAKYLGSNEFIDPDLQVGSNHFENIVAVIRSARRQGHPGVELRLTPDSLSAINGRIAELSALEDVDIDARFYGEYLSREVLLITFRELKANWLLEKAEGALSSEEFHELRCLIGRRLIRSEREIELTLKALKS